MRIGGLSDLSFSIMYMLSFYVLLYITVIFVTIDHYHLVATDNVIDKLSLPLFKRERLNAGRITVNTEPRIELLSCHSLRRSNFEFFLQF